MASAPATSVEFLDLVRKSGVVEPESLENLSNLPREPVQCASALITKGLITKFQAKLLLTGRYRGFKLGSYIVKEQIGQGGMGAVYLAEHETLRRKVALKVLTPPKGDSNSKLTLERFIREARSAAALDHPNIVRLHDIGQSADTHFLVMEYVEGQSLDQIMEKNGCMAPSKAVTYIAQAAAGLQHAYEKGFVHRDIKPGNLMLSKDGTIKILDMGLARAADNTNDKLTEILDKGAVVGTADFISPEQAMNGPIDTRSDIYSLGATFFALVTGSPPFSGNTTQKLIQHQLKEAPTISTIDKTFPPGLSSVVSKMLAKKPEDRYQTPAEVINAIIEWLPADGGRRVVAGISGTNLGESHEMENTLSEVVNATKRIGSRTNLNEVKAIKNNKALMWGGIAAGVLAVGGLIGFLLSGSNEDPKPQANNNANTVTKPVPTPSPTPIPASSTIAKSTPPKTKTSEPKTADNNKGPIQQKFPKPPANVLVRLPVSLINPYFEHLSRFQSGTNPGLQVLDHRGDGTLPPSWYRWIHSTNAEADLLVEDTPEGRAIGLRCTSGTAGFQLNSPAFTVPTSGKVYITIEYMTEPKCPAGSITFRQSLPEPRNWELFSLPPTQGAWKKISKEVDMKKANSGLIELISMGVGADATLFIKSFDVSSTPETDQ